MERNIVLSNLCYYDKRNPLSQPMENPFRKEVKCHCDNCFHGRTLLAQELLAHLDSEPVIEIPSNIPMEDLKQITALHEKIMNLFYMDKFPDVLIFEIINPIERVLEANHVNLRDYDV